MRLNIPSVRMEAIPPEARTPRDYPLIPECTALVVTLACGHKMHYGVNGAKINSELRMIVHGGFINPRNELAKRWAPCNEV